MSGTSERREIQLCFFGQLRFAEQAKIYILPQIAGKTESSEVHPGEVHLRKGFVPVILLAPRQLQQRRSRCMICRFRISVCLPYRLECLRLHQLRGVVQHVGILMPGPGSRKRIPSRLRLVDQVDRGQTVPEVLVQKTEITMFFLFIGWHKYTGVPQHKIIPCFPR